MVSYQYSTSSDRALNREATWKGQVPGRSLATVMSELRRVHRDATNISIREIAWRNEDGGGGGGAMRERMAADARTAQAAQAAQPNLPMT
jgi:hypothetical protein